MAMEGNSQTLSSVEKTFEILDYLDGEGRAGVSHVADALGYHKATVHSHLRTLHSIGYVIRDDGEYELSLQFLKNGGRVRNRLPLFREGKDEVENLATETGELANLGVEQNGRIVVVYMVEGANAAHDDAPMGKHTHVHSTALGKSILAHYREEQVNDILDERGMPALTDNTITDRDALFDQFQDVRERGFAVDEEEGRKGIKCIAAPIFGPGDEPVGALSITGPKTRLSDKTYFENISQQILDSANVIEVKLEYRE